MQPRPRRRHSARPTIRTSRRARRRGPRLEREAPDRREARAEELPQVRSLVDRRNRDERRPQADGDREEHRRLRRARGLRHDVERRLADVQQLTGLLAVDRRRLGTLRGEADTLARRDGKRPGGDPLVRPRRRRERHRLRTRILGESHALLPAQARGHVHADESADGAVRNRRDAAVRRRPRDLDLDGEPCVRRGDRIARGAVREPTGVGMRSRDELPRADAPELAELHRGDLGQHTGDHRRRRAGLASARGREHLQPGQGRRQDLARLRGERSRQLPAHVQRAVRREARSRSVLHGHPQRLRELGRADGDDDLGELPRTT